MGCVCSKGFDIEPREGYHSPPSEAVVVKPRQIPSDPSLLAKSYSFHGFEKPDATVEANKALFRTGSNMTVPRVETVGIKPVRENFFILRDRMEMRRAGKVATSDRRMNGRGSLEETTVFKRPGRAGESSEPYVTKDERCANHGGNNNNHAAKVEDFRLQKMDL